jgi:hypothetical protein
MDMLDEEFIAFWRILNQHQVTYIMVGGLATFFHGYNRVTEDVDMWIEDTLDNRKRLRTAFRELQHGDIASLETMEFVPGGNLIL